jgi:hypothetical protein
LKSLNRWISIASLAAIVAVFCTISSSQAVSRVMPLASDPDGITETCNGSPQNQFSTPYFSVGSIIAGTRYWAHANWWSTCNGAPWGFIFRRVTLRAPLYHTISNYYWVAHDGTHTQSGCFIDIVSGKQGVVCANNTQINGSLSGTNPGPLYVEAVAQSGSPCDSYVRWNDSVRYHYSPYTILATNYADVLYLCPG